MNIKSLAAAAAAAAVALGAAGCGAEPVAHPKQADALQARDASFLSRSMPPWPVPTDVRHLAQLADLPLFTKPIHVTVSYVTHLDILDGQQRVTIPKGIGTGRAGRVPIYSKQGGTIQIAGDLNDQFTLGEFFTMWGVHLSSTCVGGLCADAHHALQFYVEGVSYQGNPADIPLDANQEIAIVYGNPNNMPSPPANPPHPGRAPGTGHSGVS